AIPDADGWHNKATAISNSNDKDVKQPWIYLRTCCRSISLPPNVSAAVLCFFTAVVFYTDHCITE
ncbi:hypothetical protein OAD18_10300, partial [Oceanospirillaceae bacterium]|nr:hypothetical protein [Oceanospirillaceae bacterium]